MHEDQYWDLYGIIKDCPVLLDSEKKQALKNLEKGRVTKYIKDRLTAYHTEKNLREIQEFEKQKYYKMLDEM
jgi:hypothetical protein